MKGFGTDEKLLCQVLGRIPDPVIMKNVRQTYQQRLRKDLVQDIDKETGGYFGEACVAVARGPLEQDCYNLHDALKGAGTKEAVLDDVLLGRSNADMRAIKQEYQRIFRRSLEQDVKDDLSAKTEQLFATRSDGQLRAISQAFQQRYHKPLMNVIESNFSGHMEDALMRMLGVAEDKAMADAKVDLSCTLSQPVVAD